MLKRQYQSFNRHVISLKWRRTHIQTGVFLASPQRQRGLACRRIDASSALPGGAWGCLMRSQCGRDGIFCLFQSLAEPAANLLSWLLHTTSSFYILDGAEPTLDFLAGTLEEGTPLETWFTIDSRHVPKRISEGMKPQWHIPSQAEVTLPFSLYNFQTLNERDALAPKLSFGRSQFLVRESSFHTIQNAKQSSVLHIAKEQRCHKMGGGGC